MRSTYEYIQLVATTTFTTLKALVSSVTLSATTSYILLKADAIVGYFIKFLDQRRAYQATFAGSSLSG
jgi:hypothetical protein